jgi:hypothetical protein
MKINTYVGLAGRWQTHTGKGLVKGKTYIYRVELAIM